MKNVLGAAIAAMISLMPLCGVARGVADYEVVPMPESITPGSGRPFVLGAATTVVYPAGNSALEKNAMMLAGYIRDITGLEVKAAASAGPSGGNIVLSDRFESDNPEAYRLTVDSSGVTIDGASAAGCFYGVQTLRKALPAEERGDVELGAVTVEDAPRFGYRGAHLDVSRHFFPADSVKKYLDMMALHNMNRFHWHLTDDQGWRLPLKRHPELVTKGSVRRGTCIGKEFDSCDSVPYGGFYTPAEVQDVIAYAADRHITVIPEVDLPGHMLAALAAHPELGCTGGPYELWTTWGISDDVLCAGNEDMYRFLEEVLSEIAEIFPSEYVHIGGDECPKVRWKECAVCQAKIAELGLTDDEHSTKEDKLQGHVMAFAADVLKRHGKKVIGWDEILEGGAPDDAAIMSWRGAAGGQAAAAKGHDAVMTPNVFYYLDYYQAKDKDREPLAIGGYVPLSKCYSFKPFDGIAPENHHHILGVQANLWAEYISTFPHVQYMVLPRWSALSEVQWSGEDSRDWDAFLGRLDRMEKHYDANGYVHAAHRE